MTCPRLIDRTLDSVISFCLGYIKNPDEVLLTRKTEGRPHEGQ